MLWLDPVLVIIGAYVENMIKPSDFVVLGDAGTLKDLKAWWGGGDALLS